MKCLTAYELQPGMMFHMKDSAMASSYFIVGVIRGVKQWTFNLDELTIIIAIRTLATKVSVITWKEQFCDVPFNNAWECFNDNA